MARKDLKSVAAALAPAAARLPTQNVATPPRQEKPEQPDPAKPAEPVVQFSFGLRKSQRKELARLAAEADMTMRAFILDALRAKGLSVAEDDLLDLRRERAGG